jgi:hypothetical protein
VPNLCQPHARSGAGLVMPKGRLSNQLAGAMFPNAPQLDLQGSSDEPRPLISGDVVGGSVAFSADPPPGFAAATDSAPGGRSGQELSRSSSLTEYPSPGWTNDGKRRLRVRH